MLRERMGAVCYLLFLAEFLLLLATSNAASLPTKNTDIGEGLIPTKKDNSDTFELIRKMVGLERRVNNRINRVEQRVTNLEEELQSTEETDDQKHNELIKKLEKIEEKLRRLYPRDCIEVKNNGYVTSGMYIVWPSDKEPTRVYCDMERDGGGWIVFQRRMMSSSHESFNRSWAEYKKGFGSLDGEFWLGFDKITRFMKHSNELRIDIVPYNFTTRMAAKGGYGKYGHFHISNENATNSNYHYRLNVTDFSGNIHDSLHNTDSFNTRANRMSFSTYDRNHGWIKSTNCAQLHGAGYWYSPGCHNGYDGWTNLNGKYPPFNPAPSPTNRRFMHWQGWPSVTDDPPLLESSMMFRRKH